MSRAFGAIGEDADWSPKRAQRVLMTAVVAVLVVLGALFLLLVPRADAKQKFMSGFGQAFPAAAGTALDSCLLCHTDPVHPRESNLNNYGEDWEDGDFGDKDFLAPNLLNRDSDGDGVSNGAEIQQLSLPGDSSSSTPPTTTTTLAGTPPDGQALYAARCSACHGPNEGDLSGTGLGRSMFISITVNGQAGMPAQSNLTDEEVGAIWEYVTGAVPATTTTTLPGATTTTTIPRSGTVVYAASCAPCHGPSGGNLVGHTLGLSEIVSITNTGIGTMPGYSGSLSAAEISNVSQHIASFGASSGVTTTTLPAGTQPSGSTLYMQNCSGCHGLHGEGGPGGAVAGTQLGRSGIISVTEAGTSGMPAFGSQLSSAEIAAIADHILAMAGDAGTATVTTGPTGSGVQAGGEPPPALVEGHALFGQFCAACHGVNGEGGIGGAVAGIEISTEELTGVIRNGVGSMPGFATQLSEAEIGELVAFSAALAADAELMAVDITTTTLVENNEASFDAAGSLGGLVRELGEPDGGGGLPLVVLVAIFLGVVVAGGAVFAWMRAVRNLVG